MTFVGKLGKVQERIQKACDMVGRRSGEVTLIAVTKTVDIARIKEAYDAGLRHFGESRLQESGPKWAALPSNIRWHFIGKLQSNKAKRVAAVFDCIHTIESASQIWEIDKSGRPIDGLIEVNVAREPQKSGIFEENLDEIVDLVLNSSQVRLRGLMTVGPLQATNDEKRRVFARLRELSLRLPGDRWLSMGMSDDFEIAIQEGSTHVRVGSALFGERN